MRCVITAGPTYEPLDQVRRLTNFSTGTLGTELANYFVDAGHEVDLWVGSGATSMVPRRATRVEEFTTTSDLLSKFERHSREGSPVGAIFHAAAVSDFMFGRLWERDADGAEREIRAGKVPTRATLLAELIPTPKVILQLRRLFPEARIVGWKYEVDGDRASVWERGLRQLREARTDLCVLNGPAYGAGFGLLPPEGRLVELGTRQELFSALLAALKQVADV